MATIPADRHKDGLVLGFTVYENAILEKYRTPEYSPGGTIDRRKMRAFTEELIREYDVRPEDCGPKLAGGLSGGNQQKIIIGREIAQEPKLLIAIQPTRGLDVGAIENVHKMLIRERDKGVAVLLISFELDEVMNVSDRIAVMYDGHIQQIFQHGTVDNRTLGRVMAGGTVDESEIRAAAAHARAEAAVAEAAAATASTAATAAFEAAAAAAVSAGDGADAAVSAAGAAVAEAEAARAAADASAAIAAAFGPEEAPAGYDEEAVPVRAAVAAPAEADEEKAQMQAEIDELHKTIEDMQKRMDEILQKLSDAQ